MVQALQAERPTYKEAAAIVTIDHTASSEDHSSFPTNWSSFLVNTGSPFQIGPQRLALPLHAFTANPALADRVLSLMKNVFGDKQEGDQMDYVKIACTLLYNKRHVG